MIATISIKNEGVFDTEITEVDVVKSGCYPDRASITLHMKNISVELIVTHTEADALAQMLIRQANSIQSDIDRRFAL